MPDDHGDDAPGPVWQRLTALSATAAKHDAEIAGLKGATERLETAMAETRAEIKGEMARGFDRVETALGKVTEEAMRAFSPEAAQRLADTRASEARAIASSRQSWAVSGLMALATVAALLWPVLHR